MSTVKRRLKYQAISIFHSVGYILNLKNLIFKSKCKIILKIFNKYNGPIDKLRNVQGRKFANFLQSKLNCLHRQILKKIS